VGLASFLLINFFTTRLQANKAAMKALIVNRIGDFGLSLGIFAIFFVFGAVDYSTVFSTVTDLASSNYYLLEEGHDVALLRDPSLASSGSTKLIFFNMEFDILTVICFFSFCRCCW